MQRLIDPLRRMLKLPLLAAMLCCSIAADTPPTSTVVPAYRQADHVEILTIEGPIDSMTVQSIQRRLTEAMDAGADAIVLRINTPGGELMSTLELCRILKADAPPNTTAWIDPHAFSAGTIIALACRNIVIAPAGMFGDSAPVSPLGPIPQTERAKLESPILTEVIDSARRHQRDERLVQGFVSLGIELWLLQQRETGKRICVDASEYEAIFGTPPPEIIPSITPELGESTGEAQPLSPFFEKMMGGMSDANSDLGSMLQRPSSRPRLGPDDAEDWVLIKQVVSNDRLLALTPGEGADYGLIDGTVKTEADLQAFLGAKTINTRHRNWSEQFTAFLISWPVRLVLIVLFLVCTIIEFAAPGTGLFAIGAAVSLLILLGAPWLAGLAQWWDIVLVLLGLVLVAIELAVVPGTIFVGAVGACLVLIGLIGTFVTGDMSSTELWDGIFRGMLIVFTGLISAIIIGSVLASRFQSSRIGGRLVLRSDSGSVHGDGASSGPSSMATAPLAVGTEGVAITDLRPAGRVQCGDTIHDAVSSGQWIQCGASIKVVQSGMTIEVEEIDRD